MISSDPTKYLEKGDRKEDIVSAVGQKLSS